MEWGFCGLFVCLFVGGVSFVLFTFCFVLFILTKKFCQGRAEDEKVS